MTLRLRLLLGLVALSAVGLGVFGAITYHYTKSYVYTQVDDQLASAIEPMANRLAVVIPNDFNERGAGRIPFGAYGEVRADDGTVLRRWPPIDENGEQPQLPSKLHVGKYTAGDPPYRMVVFPVAGGGQFAVAVSATDAVRTMHRLFVIEFTVAAGVLLALGALAWWVVKLGLKPLEDMEATAGAIAAGDLSRRVEPADETTEVGRLGLALNEMLIQIEKAFDERAASEARLRRFVGDASHELRTPLTSIRGYAELFRRGAAERPEDLAKAMRRIEEEADRMGVMVDDLLLLARLDQGRPLEREPVDLTRLARDAVDDTRTIAPSRPIDYSPNGPIVVPGDEVRLRQVLGNLLQNAIRHTPPETPVHVAVEVEGDDAIVEVRDEGPGMQAADAARVFERFYRSDESRARTSGGTGLGLAIVSAIAQAHGGTASVVTAPGEGATFRVRLPRSIPETN